MDLTSPSIQAGIAETKNISTANPEAEYTMLFKSYGAGYPVVNITPFAWNVTQLLKEGYTVVCKFQNGTEIL